MEGDLLHLLLCTAVAKTGWTLGRLHDGWDERVTGVGPEMASSGGVLLQR